MEQVLPYGKSITWNKTNHSRQVGSGKLNTSREKHTIMHESECYFFLHLLHQNSCLVFVKKTSPLFSSWIVSLLISLFTEWISSNNHLKMFFSWGTMYLAYQNQLVLKQVYIILLCNNKFHPTAQYIISVQ
jgi:hypothetical protein